ncbi:Light-harvesting complex [Amphidinium carterae]
MQAIAPVQGLTATTNTVSHLRGATAVAVRVCHQYGNPFSPESACAGAAMAATFLGVCQQSSRSRRKTRYAFENETGVQPPCGFWDPMGFTDDGDMQAYRRRRSVELKHGRIAMLATMGFITPEVIGHWPGYLSPSAQLKFADVPSGLDAFGVVPGLGWVQILVYFMLVEYTGGFDDYRNGTPGDYGWKVLSSSDPEERRRKLNAELANGRLAMVAIMAMLFQNGLAGSTGPEMWLPNFAALKL